MRAERRVGDGPRRFDGALFAFARWCLLGRRERALPSDIRTDLAKLLYSRIGNLILLGVCGEIAGITAWLRDGQAAILVIATVGSCLMVLRCAMMQLFNRRWAAGKRIDPDLAIILYSVAAGVTSLCWGMVIFSSLVFTKDSSLCLAMTMFATAAAGAIAARNAAAPRMAGLQVVAILAPMIPGSLLMDGSARYFLSAVILAVILGLFGVIRDIFQQLLELYQTQMTLRLLSNTDELTQIPNRREFTARCAAAFAAGAPVSMLMIDVDFFKSFNDLYGHPAGDACLKRIAALLQAQLRSKEGLVARYGGEEFAVLLLCAGAGVIAQRLCDAVANARLAHENRPDGLGIVTISVGVSSTAAGLGDSEELVKAADEALYAAKKGGRNRVWVRGA